MTLYFAYGSNMNKAVMARHAPDAVAVGIAKREHWRFIIAREGYGSIEPSPGGTVHGVVWKVSDRDLVGLDAYESVETGLYHRRDLKVSLDDQPVRALTYIVTEPGTGWPKPGYIAQVMAGGGEFGLPFHYLTEISRWAPFAQRVVIHGRVQGVGYRAWTEHKASQRGLCGWVRNRRDGTVEALFFGPGPEVDAMIMDCRRGPPGAAVERIEERQARDDECPQAGSAFAVRPTV